MVITTVINLSTPISVFLCKIPRMLFCVCFSLNDSGPPNIHLIFIYLFCFTSTGKNEREEQFVKRENCRVPPNHFHAWPFYCHRWNNSLPIPQRRFDIEQGQRRSVTGVRCSISPVGWRLWQPISGAILRTCKRWHFENETVPN
ncbi:hypothetical protein TNCV_3358111 [Trichonephila clavipes]|nr:hypothetical protein TNCV_3358111 [Trichonephila clavipes]